MKLLPKLNTMQLNRLSEIVGNMSLVFLATFVLPFFTGTYVDLVTMFAGVILTAGSWAVSILLL